MDEGGFWGLIDQSFPLGCGIDDGMETLSLRLEGLARSDLVAFQSELRRAMTGANTWDMVAAACFVGAGNSDDGFQDFLGWLISRGSTAYREVLADVQRLADFEFQVSPTEEWYLEELQYLAPDLGGDGDDPELEYIQLGGPSGERIDLSRRELAARYPRLWERFGAKFMIGLDE